MKKLFLIILATCLFGFIISGVIPEKADAAVCGDGICEYDENIYNCHTDCYITGFEGGVFGADLLGSFSEKQILGFNIVFGELGLEVARFNIFWERIEPERGVYNWASLDSFFDEMQNLNVPILLTLRSVSDWGTEYLDCRNTYYQYVHRRPSAIPTNVEDYMNFIDAIVNRYKHGVRYWQVENEVHGAVVHQELPGCPPSNNFWMGTKEEYIGLLASTYTKIKQVDPTAIVLMSSFMGESLKGGKTNYLEFTDYQLEYGLDYTDAVDVHLYGCPREDNAEKLGRFHEKVSNLGYEKDFWATEHGEIDNYTCHDDVPEFKQSFDSPEELKLQSEELVKRLVLAFGSGVKKVFRLNINRPPKSGPAERWNHISLTFDEEGLDRKPSFYTNKLLVEKLNGFTSVEKIDEGVYRFNINKPVYVVWSDIGRTVDFSSYIQTANARITHIVTELVEKNNPIYPTDEIISASVVPLSETPVFIEEYYPGDINNDGVVDIIDLGIFLSSWGGSGQADLNNDGKVDIIDLGILLSNWG